MALTSGHAKFREHLILRALMRGRYKFYNSRGKYVYNVLSIIPSMVRPSNFLITDILDYLQRVRKTKIDFAQEGYVLPLTIINKMGQLGYDEEDVFLTLQEMVKIGFVEPDSLVIENLDINDAVRLHASGFIHSRYFAQNPEYLVAITSVTEFSSRDTAMQIGNIWGSQGYNSDISLSNKKKILQLLAEYVRSELQRRCKRHAFYGEFGYGGRSLVANVEKAAREILIVDRSRSTSFP